ncbi:MAG: ATP-dependent helicase HrpB [Verrucomicrobia bacterium]|nr:ATP-dependent helicase HrpB [Verrucomicrobiota bacterium]
MAVHISNLPIESLRQSLVGWFARGGLRNAVIKAPTGSGKSTQVPQMLLDHGIAGDKRIVVLQPRRIAARMLAARVASERQARLGDEVGYQVRFDNVSSAKTRILFVTEGVMLRHLHDDPKLSQIGCLVIDEFHERHLDGDICLAWANAVQAKHRPDLKIIVMSATITPEPLREFMEPCEIFDSAGRTFPVEIGYQAPSRDKMGNTEPVWDQAARAAEDLIVRRGVDGDLLMFMPGGHEIRKTITAINGRSFSKGFRILPLHGELTPQQQDEVLAPGGSRRIIVSTNVAETSLTIEGVRGVIDSGLARTAEYDTRRGINTLTVQKISRASADQRAGRAGRLGPGVCLRLWPEREHLHRAENELPEIRRIDLSEALLALAVVSETAGMNFEWYEAPFSDSRSRAISLLRNLGAIEGKGDTLLPTELGRKMSAFPLHPRFSRMLVTAAQLGCLEDAALCAAIEQGRDLLLKPTEQTKRKQEELFERHDITEFQALIRAFEKAASLDFDPEACARYSIHARAAFEAMRSRDQIVRLCKRTGLNSLKDEDINPVALAKCLLSAFSDHLGVETITGSRVFSLAAGYRGHLDKNVNIKPPSLLVAAEVAEIQGKALQVKLNLVTKIEEEWLRELFPNDLTTSRRAMFDAVNKRVVNREETRFRDLVMHSRERGEPDLDEAARLLADEIVAGRLELPEWNDRTEQWITRLNCLADWMPELELSKINDEDRRLLIEQTCHGATAARQLRERTPDAALNAWLSSYQRDLLDQFAPEQVKLTSGRTARVQYRNNAPPMISVILQHLYDTNENPKIAGGKIPVLVEILAPSRRPVQLTADLGNFWKTSYTAVKTELRGRYPKHEWR